MIANHHKIKAQTSFLFPLVMFLHIHFDKVLADIFIFFITLLFPAGDRTLDIVAIENALDYAGYEHTG
jgi:hypothetical protein